MKWQRQPAIKRSIVAVDRRAGKCQRFTAEFAELDTRLLAGS